MTAHEEPRPVPELIADIRARLRTPIRPFPPFEVRFAGGRRRRVPQPGTLAIAGTNLVYLDRHDRLIAIPAQQVRQIVDLPTRVPRRTRPRKATP